LLSGRLDAILYFYRANINAKTLVPKAVKAIKNSKRLACILVLFLLSANAAVAVESTSHAGHNHSDMDNYSLVMHSDHEVSGSSNSMSDAHCETQTTESDTVLNLALQLNDSHDECGCQDVCCTTSSAFVDLGDSVIAHSSDVNRSLSSLYQSKDLDLPRPPPEN
jgi:hypothetical protein